MQTETTATTTAPPPEGAAATTAATPPASSAATAVPPAGDQGATTTPPAGATTPPATAAQGQDGKPAGEAKPAGVPEKYEPFKLAEGALSADELAGVEATARDLGLSQEGAQKLAELRAADKASFAQAQQQVVADARATWVAEIKADKTLGGDKLTESLAVAKAGVQALDPDGTFQKLLEATGFGDHPEVVRLFHRAGKALAPDSVVPGGKAPSGAQSLAQRMYPGMNP